MIVAAVLSAALLTACTRTPPVSEPSPSVTPSPPASFLPGPSPAATLPSPRPTPSATSFPSSFRGQDLTRIPTTARIVALTFDAGANADAVPAILKALKDEGITATFFLTGDFVHEFPAASKAIAQGGHRLANHSMTHPHLPALSIAQIRAQIRDAEVAIQTVTGKNPQPYFRFPYGDRNPGTIEIVNSLGYVAVRWTVDSLGWQGTSKHTAASVAERVLGTAQPGQIVLMHVGSNPDDDSILDADALPAIINGLRAKGYTFVTLDRLVVT